MRLRKHKTGANMNEQIAVKDNAVPLEWCSHVINLMGEGKPASIGAGERVSDIRRSNVTFVDNMIDNWTLFQPVMDIVNEINSQFYNFSIDLPESLQITRYDSDNQGFYEPHKDSGPVNTDMMGRGRVRKLSIVIQLSQPEAYEGGELVFPDNKEYFPEAVKAQGTAIIFPSYLLHGVTPVTKGVRHSLVGWFLGQPFK